MHSNIFIAKKKLTIEFKSRLSRYSSSLISDTNCNITQTYFII